MKHKRSEYYCGILDAERDKKIGWSLTKFCHESFWITLTFEAGPTIMQIQGDSDEWTDGYIDYWTHAQRNNL